MKKLPAYQVYLILSAGFAFIGGLVFTFSMIYWVEVVKLNPLQLVLTGTVLESTVFLCEVPTGIVADLYSRRLSVIIGFFLIGAGFLLEGSIPLFATVLLAQVLWGLGYTFTSGATDAWITDEIGEAQAAKAFLRAGQAGNLGALAGLLVSLGVGSLRVNLPILAGGGLTVLLAGFLLLCMPETGFNPTPDPERNTWQHLAATLKAGLNMARRRPALRVILLIGLFYGLYSEAYDRLWLKLMVDTYTFPPLGPLAPEAWFGVLRAAGMVLSIGATEWMTRRLEGAPARGVIRPLVGLTGLLVAGLLVFAQARALWLSVAAMLLISAARSVIGPLYTTWVNQRIDPQVRATVLSISSQVDAVGQIAGGPALGWLGAVAGIRAAITAAALVLAPVLGLYARALGERFEAIEEAEA